MSREITLLYFFSWNFIWFLQKEPIKLQNFRLSIAQVKFHQICTLIGFFCWKYIKFQLNKYRGVMSHDTEEWCKIWRKTDLWFGKWHEEFGKFSPEHSKISKICTLMSCFWPKYIMFELKKYRGVIFHDTEESCKIWRKTDLWFGKWHKKFGKFSSEHLKVLKLGTFMGSFCPKWKMHELKIYRGNMCNDTKVWSKIWRGIDLSFQNWHKEFDEFWLEYLKVSKMYALMSHFWPKYIMFELKKYRRVIFHDTREWCKIWRKTDSWFGKWHEEFGKFSPE